MINLAAVLPYIVFTSITPGPSNFMSMYSAAKFGLRGARRYVCGTICGYFVKAILCALLSILFATFIPDAMPYLKWVGGAYLLYLAASILLSTRKKNHMQKNTSESGSSTFRSGILLQCLNMKSWLSLLTMFSVYITGHTTSFSVVALWILIAVCTMFISTFFWLLFGKATKRIYERHMLLFNIIMAAALVYCAITAVL